MLEGLIFTSTLVQLSTLHSLSTQDCCSRDDYVRIGEEGGGGKKFMQRRARRVGRGESTEALGRALFRHHCTNPDQTDADPPQ